MYGEDDRVITLLEQINLMDRLIPYEFDDKFDYMSQPNFIDSDKKLFKLKLSAIIHKSLFLVIMLSAFLSKTLGF